MKKYIFIFGAILCLSPVLLHHSTDTETVSCIKIESKDMPTRVLTQGAVIAGEDAAYIYAEIPLSEADKIDVGNAGVIKCRNRSFDAEVIGISPYEYSKTATLRLKACDAAGLYSQNYVDITVYGKTFEDTVTVPFEALLHKNGKDYLWILRDDVMECTEVVTGVNNGLETQILSGLQSGDIVAECPVWNPDEIIRIKR